MELLNQVLTLVTKFAIIGGGLWLVWGRCRSRWRLER